MLVNRTTEGAHMSDGIHRCPAATEGATTPDASDDVADDAVLDLAVPARSRDAVVVATSGDELLAGVDERSPFKTSDSRSGSRFERVSSGGVAMILKYLCVDDDWIVRGTGDLNCRVLTLIESGLFDQVPGCVDHATVAAAPYVSAHGHRGAALMMRDVGHLLVPPGDTVVAPDSQRRYLEHMAALHAQWWEHPDAVDTGVSRADRACVQSTPSTSGCRRHRRPGRRGRVP